MQSKNGLHSQKKCYHNFKHLWRRREERNKVSQKQTKITTSERKPFMCPVLQHGSSHDVEIDLASLTSVEGFYWDHYKRRLRKYNFARCIESATRLHHSDIGNCLKSCKLNLQLVCRELLLVWFSSQLLLTYHGIGVYSELVYRHEVVARGFNFWDLCFTQFPALLAENTFSWFVMVNEAIWYAKLWIPPQTLLPEYNFKCLCVAISAESPSSYFV